MGFPAFFEQAPVLRLRDGLAALLGVTPDGVIEYRYADAVRLAGHSCPTVAGAWLCARAGLRALYGDTLPERGNIAVSLPQAEDAGVSGVIGQVMTLVTGAAGADGFKGLAGGHARNGLLRYGDPGIGALRMRRRDSGQVVEVALDTSPVPVEPDQRNLFALVVQGQADAAQQRRFGDAWQGRVRRMLLEHAEDPAVVQVRWPAQGRATAG
ncbi:FmdE family protein [Luteimonas sp. A611]